MEMDEASWQKVLNLRTGKKGSSPVGRKKASSGKGAIYPVGSDEIS